MQNSPVIVWRERGIPFYKHKQDSSVLDFVALLINTAPSKDFRLETCII